jgi:predicted ArsR family transcriptional regulator
MDKSALGEAKRRVVDRLKRWGTTTAAELARELDLTVVAIRQHLQGLEALGLARPRKISESRRGRPALGWSLTSLGHRLFPDRHDELTVAIVAAVRRALGEEGLSKVLEARAREQAREYGRELPSSSASLKKRVTALARRRTQEGYLAEVVVERPGRYLLIESHCPICEAAKACVGLCGAELAVFEDYLGPDVTVERVAHLLEGDERCAYRIEKR